MKIQVISDLHLEHGDLDFRPADCDLLIVAGDLHVKARGVEWLKSKTGDLPTVYVLGNHEFYGEKIPTLVDKLRSSTEGTNIRVLENECLDIQGYRIFGSTFWTNMQLFDREYVAAESAKRVLTDFKKIRMSGSYRKMQPTDFQKLNASSQLALRQAFKDIPASRRICVTHHAPSPRSLPLEFLNDPVSCAYASNLEDLVKEINPAFWFHGHIHTTSDYRINGTRVICNPRGYVEEPNSRFDGSLVIDTASSS